MRLYRCSVTLYVVVLSPICLWHLAQDIILAVLSKKHIVYITFVHGSPERIDLVIKIIQSTMAALSNDVLTAQLRELQTQVVSIGEEIKTILPRMNSATETLQQEMNTMDNKLEAALNPLVNADIINVMKNLDKVQQDANTHFNAQIQTIMTSLQNQDSEHKNSAQMTNDRVQQLEPTIQSLSAEVAQVKSDLMGERSTRDVQNASIHSTMATLSAKFSASSPGGGSRSSEPIVTHKLMMTKQPLTGSEDIEAFDDWYEDMANDFELLIPGAKLIMQEAEKSTGPITLQKIRSHSNPELCLKVSRELFSVLNKKTTLNARNQIKSLEENEGLEGWRLLRMNLHKKDRQRLQKEYDQLTDITPVKIHDFKDFPDLHRRWEFELKKFTNIDADYNMGKFQKRNVLYRALPAEIQNEVDSVSARTESSLEDYDSFIEFVTNLSRSWKYQKQIKPRPLTANMVDEQPPNRPQEEPQAPQEEAVYSVEEWQSFLQTDEGREYIVGDKQLPQTGKEALLSLTGQNKGKGKGWQPNWQQNWQSGKNKGKGKDTKGKGKDGKGKGKGGKGKGPCHGCGEYGHFIRDCPSAGKGINAVDDGWQYMPTRYQPSGDYRVALALTEEPFNGYGKANFVQTSTSTQFPFKFDESDVEEFPLPDSVVSSTSKIPMPKFTRKSQNSRKEIPTVTCDADDMKVGKFDKILQTHGSKPSESETIGIAHDVHEDKNPSEIPVPDQPVIDKRVPSSRNRQKKIQFCKDFSDSADQCSDGCCVPNVNKPDDTKHNEPNDMNPPPPHWKEMLDEAIRLDEMKHKASLLPGCGPKCGHGIHHLTECRAFSTARGKFDPSDTIAMSARLDVELNLLTSAGDQSNDIMNVDVAYTWVQIPCAVDSGACAHVSPPGVVGQVPKDQKITKGKYFAADGSPIDEMGQQTINAVLDGGTELQADFDIAKITRPLLSVSQMTKNGHQVVFGKDYSYIQLYGSRTRIPLRSEGKLYMLDMWVKVPLDVARSSPFVRQVSHP